MLASLDSHQLAEWYTFLNLEPIGDLRADYRAGMLCATLANYAGKARIEGAEAANPADFFGSLEENHPAPAAPAPLLMHTPEEQAQLIKASLFGIRNG